MNRPYIVCHMMSSVDGKITGPYMETKSAEAVGAEYERINAAYHPQAWMCGRVTTDENFTFHRLPYLPARSADVPEGDYVAVKDAEMYYVSVDASGRIGWTDATLRYADRPPAHIIEVLSERAGAPYRAFLRELGISYIIAGREHLDCSLAVEKLKSLFGIRTLMLSGGGYINGSFLNEGLVDELSLVIAPVTDCSSDTVTVFEQPDFLPVKEPVEFSLKHAEQLRGGGVWLRYVPEKQTQQK